jgi:hypothetical protein
LSSGTQQIPVKHIMNECGLARAGNAGHACEHAERQIDIDVFKIVLSRANQLDR